MYENYDDARLHRVYHSSDYTAEARERAHTLLMQRGFSADSIAAWRDERMLETEPLPVIPTITATQVLQAERRHALLYRFTP